MKKFKLSPEEEALREKVNKIRAHINDCTHLKAGIHCLTCDLLHRQIVRLIAEPSRGEFKGK